METIKEAIDNKHPLLLFKYTGKKKPQSIELKKEGKYIHCSKQNSNIVISIDLQNDKFYKTKNGETQQTLDIQNIASWFYTADVITYDYKFGLVVLYNKYRRKLEQYKNMAYFVLTIMSNSAQNYEKWLALGIDLEITNRLLNMYNDGESVHRRNKWAEDIYISPSDVPKSIIKLIKKEKNLNIEKLNEYKELDEKTFIISKKLLEYAISDEYEHLFTIKKRLINSRAEVKYSNMITDKGFYWDRKRLYSIIKDYNIDIDRFVQYLSYLKTFEHTNIEWVADNYRDYLKAEKELRNDRLSKMDKYPNNLVQQHHNKTSIIKEIEFEKALLQEKENMKLEKIIYKENKNKYEEINKRRTYSIVAPESSIDIIEEGNSMNHCVGGYVGRIRQKSTCIMFMRPRDKIEKSFITVEIQNGKLSTALGKNNRRLNKEEKEFLEGYAERKNLEYTAYATIGDE